MVQDSFAQQGYVYTLDAVEPWYDGCETRIARITFRV
jgi:hypothetical protein